MKRHLHLSTYVSESRSLVCLYVHPASSGVITTIRVWDRVAVEGAVTLIDDKCEAAIRMPLSEPHAALEAILGTLQFRARAESEAEQQDEPGDPGYHALRSEDLEPEEMPDMRPPREGESLCLSPGDDA